MEGNNEDDVPSAALLYRGKNSSLNHVDRLNDIWTVHNKELIPQQSGTEKVIKRAQKAFKVCTPGSDSDLCYVTT